MLEIIRMPYGSTPVLVDAVSLRQQGSSRCALSTSRAESPASAGCPASAGPLACSPPECRPRATRTSLPPCLPACLHQHCLSSERQGFSHRFCTPAAIWTALCCQLCCCRASAHRGSFCSCQSSRAGRGGLQPLHGACMACAVPRQSAARVHTRKFGARCAMRRLSATSWHGRTAPVQLREGCKPCEPP